MTAIVDHRGASPLHVSDFAGFRPGRAEFTSGALALGIGTERKPLRAQQYIIADALNATRSRWVPMHGTFAICVPRRATKSSSVLAVALGRMIARDDYQVAYTHVTQQAAQKRWLKDVVEPIQRKHPDPKTSPWIINRSPGAMFITYKATGSTMVVLGPTADAFIGNAFDMIIADEAQKLPGGDAAEDLMRGMTPTMDTRTFNGVATGQLVLLGTAGAYQGDLFWDTLERGRNGQGGIVEFAAPPDTPLHDTDRTYVAGTTSDPEVWKRAHPGIGTITPLSVVEERFLQLAPVEFAKDYLGIWPAGSTSTFLDLVKWGKLGQDGDLPSPPRQFALAVAVHPEQLAGSIAAAWYEDGVAVAGLLAHRTGVRWIASEAAALSRKYNVPIHYNAQTGANSMVAEEFATMTPRPKTVPMPWPQISNAAELFVAELNAENIRHFAQPDLDAAIPLVTRYVNRNTKRWAFTRDSAEQDITPVEALSMAIQAAKTMPVKRIVKNVTLQTTR